MSNQTMIILYSEPVSVSCQACTGKPGSQCTGFQQHTTTFAENRMCQCTHSRLRVHVPQKAATALPNRPHLAPAFRIPSADPLKATNTCEAVSTILTPTEVIPTFTSLRPCAGVVWPDHSFRKPEASTVKVKVWTVPTTVPPSTPSSSPAPALVPLPKPPHHRKHILWMKRLHGIAHLGCMIY